MKKIYAALFVFVFLGANIYAQDTSENSDDKPEGKKGWSFGVLPTITYNSDLGFQYGGLIDLYNYGDGENFPKYNERYYLEISRFTKGSGINRFSFESNSIIPGRTLFFDINYQPDQQFDFLGGNGYESVYNSSWEDRGSSDYKSKMFYKNQTKSLKVKLDVLNPIANGWSWVAGFEYYYYTINTLDVDKYNDGRDDNEMIPDTGTMPGLWDRYKKWGLINPENADGGSFMGLKLGAMYDTRDNWTNASKGIWSEAILVWAPSFIGNTGTSYLKINITHRQYFTILKDRLTFAYRLGYAGNITGNEPYFALPIMYSVMLKGAANEGLGGSRTLRGIRRNRVVGDGELYGNAEFRFKFYKFQLFKQNFYLSTNVFMDAGRVVQLLDIKEKVGEINNNAPLEIDQNSTKPIKDDPAYKAWGNYAIGIDAEGNRNGDTLDDYFNFGAEALHVTYGIGFRIAMNENFVVGIDYGRTFNEQDGPSGMYVGLNYTF